MSMNHPRRTRGETQTYFLVIALMRISLIDSHWKGSVPFVRLGIFLEVLLANAIVQNAINNDFISITLF